MTKTTSDSILGRSERNPGFWITLKFSLILLSMWHKGNRCQAEYGAATWRTWRWRRSAVSDCFSSFVMLRLFVDKHFSDSLSALCCNCTHRFPCPMCYLKSPKSLRKSEGMCMLIASDFSQKLSAKKTLIRTLSEKLQRIVQCVRKAGTTPRTKKSVTVATALRSDILSD